MVLLKQKAASSNSDDLSTDSFSSFILVNLNVWDAAFHLRGTNR